MAITLPAGMKITGEILPAYEDILTPEALALVDKLHRAFEPRRQELLAARVARAKRLDAGEIPDFLPEDKGDSGFLKKCFFVVGGLVLIVLGIVGWVLPFLMEAMPCGEMPSQWLAVVSVAGLMNLK